MISLHVHWAIAGNGTLFFSEYVEGTTSNRSVEIYNTSANTIDLASVSALVRIYTDGSTTPTTTIVLNGTIASRETFVLAHNAAAFAPSANQTSNSLSFTGNDVVALVINGALIDVIGRIGEDPPGGEWGSGLTSTENQTLRRKSLVCAGDGNGSDAFDPSIEWNGLAVDVVDGLGTHDANCQPV